MMVVYTRLDHNQVNYIVNYAHKKLGIELGVYYTIGNHSIGFFETFSPLFKRKPSVFDVIHISKKLDIPMDRIKCVGITN